MADDEAHIIGFSAAWGVVALIFGGTGAAAGIQAATPRSGFPWLPVILLGLVTVGALYLVFATLCGWWPTRSEWWPARRLRGAVASAATSASQTTDQASEVPENEPTNPASPLPRQGRSVGPATDGPTPPSSPSSKQPKPWRKSVGKAFGAAGRLTNRFMADQLASVAEKRLSENPDKVPGDLTELEEAAGEARKALKGTDNDAIFEAVDKLRQVLEETEGETPGLGD